MEQFNHTLISCRQLANEKQLELLRICRKQIYVQIMESIKNSNREILIPLDTRLDNIYRKKLIQELLVSFGNLNLIKNTSSNPQQKGNAEFCISDKSEIKDDITGIRIVL